jgi:hypothetical protein
MTSRPTHGGRHKGFDSRRMPPEEIVFDWKLKEVLKEWMRTLIESSRWEEDELTSGRRTDFISSYTTNFLDLVFNIPFDMEKPITLLDWANLFKLDRMTRRVKQVMKEIG